MRAQLKWQTNFQITLVFAIFASYLGPSNAHAYPDFIGYGYNNCAACHDNPYGNGPLTDYGRALFSQEIAARTWISKSVSDEKLAELSGFIPGAKLPFFIRPSANYAGLYLLTQPGSPKSQSRWINMQRDFSLAVAFDQEQKTLLSVTYGLLDMPSDYYGTGQQTQFVSREHYLRQRFGDQWTVMIGLMDKVYGIRIADHTSYSRSRIGFGQDDQAHGVVVQYAKENWDVGVNVFAGNLFKPESNRQKGFSAMGEKELTTRNRIGASVANFGNDFYTYQRVAIHDRWGLDLAKGSSLIAEFGFRRDQTKATGQSTLGDYFLLRSLTRLARGYNLLAQFDQTIDDFTSTSPNIQRWTFGFLTFPFQRVETDVTAVQTRSSSTVASSDDQWSLQGQLHVSF